MPSRERVKMGTQHPKIKLCVCSISHGSCRPDRQTEAGAHRCCRLLTECCPRSKRCPEPQGGGTAGQHSSRARQTPAPGHRQRGAVRARPYLVPVVSGQLGLGEEPHGGFGRRPEAQLGLGAGSRQKQEQEQEQQAGQRRRSARHGAERAPPRPEARPGPGKGAGRDWS